MSHPADPPPHVEQIVVVMRQAGSGVHGDRLRALIVVLWRAGLRIGEALDLHEGDLEPGSFALLVREGKGGRRREVGVDDWGWQQLSPWLERRRSMPIGPLFCVIDGPTRGRPWAAPAVRIQLRRLAEQAGGAAPLCAAPAAARPRRRDGPRRGAVQRDSAPARSREPTRHHGLPRGHRQRRDHQCRPRPSGTDDARQRRASRLRRGSGASATLKASADAPSLRAGKGEASDGCDDASPSHQMIRSRR